MPMSRCRYCGKMIPNIFHKYHEEQACRVRRGLDKREPPPPGPMDKFLNMEAAEP